LVDKYRLCFTVVIMIGKDHFLVTIIFCILLNGCGGDYRVDSDLSSANLDIPTSRQYFQESSTAGSASIETKEPTGVITLRQALSLALLQNPELAAFSWEVRAADARRLQASLLPNPEFAAEVEEFGGSGGRSGFDGAETSIQLGQLIELAGKRPKRTRLAALDKDLAGWDYESKRLDVMNQVAQAFVDVLAAQERLALLKELMELSEQVYSTVEQRVEAGKDSPVEETKAKVVLTTVQIEWERAKRTLVSVRKQLAATWGDSTPAFDGVAGQFDNVSPIPSDSELTALISQNPDVARWEAELAQRQAAIDLEKAKAVPDPTIFGGTRRFNETDDTAFVLGVSIPLPLFDRNQGSILEAQHRLARAAEERRAAETGVYTTLAESYQALSSSFAEATALRNDVLPGARSAFDAAGQGYREGKLDYLQLLDAQRTLFEARGQYIESLAAYHKASAQVERLIGQGLDSREHNQPNKEKEQTP
jgi:cobalt-zinc-cadmium efflux system outer membrane protein